MYHAVFPDNDNSSVDSEDLPYAVSLSDFRRQLDLLAEHKVDLYGAGKNPDIVITFDDGHASGLHLVAAELCQRGLCAYFFITGAFIDQRRYFMSGDELAELSRLPGMCIGSHGMTHRFFDDMSAEESVQELLASQGMIESLCGSACYSMSFPGGRTLPETIEQLVKAGYKQWFGSQIGLVDATQWHDQSVSDKVVWPRCEHQDDGASKIQRLDASYNQRYEDRWSLSAQPGRRPLPRVAIRRTTALSEFRKIINQDPGYFRRKQLNSQLKHFTRRVLGNRLYHGLYKSLATR